MKVEALNCPNCGGNVTSDSSFCRFCGSRLKTAACVKCLGLMFVGAKHCSHCGEAVAPVAVGDRKLGDCPRCRSTLQTLEVEGLDLGECDRCDGMWIDVATFERVCADQEKQAAVLRSMKPPRATAASKIKYVPCPECRVLMNRSNFARSSGVIIDTCRKHGVWCDAEELPKIIEFIREGGVDLQRDKEKRQLDEQRRELIDRERAALRDSRIRGGEHFDTHSPIASFLRRIFD
jgi:Zn-finger nucleic acid-binding protein